MAFGEYAGQPTEAVTAEQLEEDRSIITPRGVVEGHKGDWEVRSADGNVQKMTDEEWQKATGSPSDEESDEKLESADEDRETDSEEDSETPEDSPPDSSKTRAEKSKGKF